MDLNNGEPDRDDHSRID